MNDSTQTETRPKTAFVSGPIEPPENYFKIHYEPALLEAIAAGHSFIMGPAPGMDTMSLHFLISQGVDPNRITVYFAGFEVRLKEDGIQWFIELGGQIKVEGDTTSQRDAAMTRDSDYDILRYMTIKEQKAHYKELYYFRVSATEKNERRRKGLPLNADFHLADHSNTTSTSRKAVKELLKGLFGVSQQSFKK